MAELALSLFGWHKSGSDFVVPQDRMLHFHIKATAKSKLLLMTRLIIVIETKNADSGRVLKAFTFENTDRPFPRKCLHNVNILGW